MPIHAGCVKPTLRLPAGWLPFQHSPGTQALSTCARAPRFQGSLAETRGTSQTDPTDSYRSRRRPGVTNHSGKAQLPPCLPFQTWTNMREGRPFPTFPTSSDPWSSRLRGFTPSTSTVMRRGVEARRTLSFHGLLFPYRTVIIAAGDPTSGHGAFPRRSPGVELRTHLLVSHPDEPSPLFRLRGPCIDQVDSS